MGFAFNGLWGGAVDYGGNFAGRTFVTETNLTVLSLMPSVAYRVTDRLSLGAGVGAVYGEFGMDLKTSLDASAATVELHDASDWGVVGVVGVLFEPSEETRIGLNYRTKAELNMKGSVISPLPATPSFTAHMNT